MGKLNSPFKLVNTKYYKVGDVRSRICPRFLSRVHVPNVTFTMKGFESIVFDVLVPIEPRNKGKLRKTMNTPIAHYL